MFFATLFDTLSERFGMQSLVFYIGLCLILPILLLCFYLEKRARRIMISMICGALAGLCAYCINHVTSALFSFSDLVFTSVVGPITEEILKFIPVLVVALIVRKGKRGSAANAFAVGVGFCVVENFYYLFSSLDTANVVWIIVRCVGTGLMHSMTTTFMGLGLYFTLTKSRGRALNLAGGLLAAVAFHCLYNFMVANEVLRLFAIPLPIIAFLVFFLVLKGDEVHNFLWDTPAEQTPKEQNK